MAFNREAAKEAGYSDQEIDAYLKGREIQTKAIESQKKQPGIIGSLLKPFTDTAKKTISAVEYLPTLFGQPKLSPTVLPFTDKKLGLNEQELERASKLSTAVTDTAKSTAGLAAYGIPFGKGSNILTKALLPGGAVGGLYGVSDERKSNPLTDILAGGATAGVLRGATNTLGFLGRKGTQSFPRTLMGGVFKEAPKAERTAIKKGNELYNIALKKGQSGPPEDIYNLAVKNINKYENELQNKLQNSKRTVDIKTIRKATQPYINDLLDAGNKSNADTIFNRVNNLEKRHGSHIPIAMANKIKRTLYDEIRESSFGQFSTESKEGLKGIARSIKENIGGQIKGADTINKELSEWGRIADAMVEAIRSGKRGVNALDVTLGFGGMAGTMATGNPLIMAPFAANIIRESPTAATNLATLLHNIGKIRKPEVSSGILDKILGQTGGRAGALFSSEP